jgi:hypothetical protein
MTSRCGARARTIWAMVAATMLLAAGLPAFASNATQQADRPTVAQQSPLSTASDNAVRCQGGVNACLSSCRAHNRAADKECKARHGALQFGSCKPDPKHCSCFATPPSCTSFAH